MTEFENSGENHDMHTKFVTNTRNNVKHSLAITNSGLSWE